MRYFLFLFSFFFLIPVVSHASSVSPNFWHCSGTLVTTVLNEDCSAGTVYSIGDTMSSLDFFGDLPPDTLVWACGNNDTTDNCVDFSDLVQVYSGTSTIIGYAVYAASGSAPFVSCNDAILPDPLVFGTFYEASTYSTTYNAHCQSISVGNFQTGYQYMVVYYVPRDTRIVASVATSSVGVGYRDWLLAVQWIIFLLAFVTWGYVFSPLSKR